MIDFKLPKKLTKLEHKYMPINHMCIDILRDLNAFFEDDNNKVVAWLTTKNFNFGGIAPLKLMQIGREHVVAQFILNAQHEGNWP